MAARSFSLLSLGLALIGCTGGGESSPGNDSGMGELILVQMVLMAGLTGCGGASRYPLSIPHDPAAALRVEAAVAWVASDRPADGLSEEARVARVLLSIAEGAHSGPEGAGDSETRVQAWDALGRQAIKSARFPTVYDGAAAWHQITVGVIAVPYSDFVRSFDPAANWGRNLASYRGGEVAVDARDDEGRATLQRERMVLGTPWYAVGAPDLDMEKYEVVARTEDATRIGWVVTASHNASVDIDVGYVIFRSVLLRNRLTTLVAFNSVHRIETGFVGLENDMVGENVAGAFVANIEHYRQVVGESREDGR